MTSRRASGGRGPSAELPRVVRRRQALAFTWGVACLGVACLGASASLAAEPVERAVVRFTASELGGTDAPRFILERELAFEARLEALTEPGFRPGQSRPYRERHVRAAVERHIAEEILSALEVTPGPSEAEVAERARTAELALALRVGGRNALDQSLAAEGLSRVELLRVTQRRARASLYLDRMVAPMLNPTEQELRNLYRSGRAPFRGEYQAVRADLHRWLVARRLRGATLDYFDRARARLEVHYLF